MTVLIGRESELATLKQHLADALNGKGSTVLISGEPGIGKTALVDEISHIALEKGFRVQRGAAVQETIQPFNILTTAFHDLVNEPLFEAEEFVSFTELFAITPSGLLLAKASSKEGGLDADIFSGMLTAVQSFVSDSFDTSGSLGKLEYGNMKILIENAEHMCLTAVLEGQEHPDMAGALKRTVLDIESRYGQLLKGWSGNMRDVEPIAAELKELANRRFSMRKDLSEINLNNEITRISELVLGVLGQASTVSPIILILEDIHWAGETSLKVMEYIARNATDKRLFLIFTARTSAPGPWVGSREKLMTEGTAQEMTLGGFGLIALNKLLDTIYWPNDFPESMHKQIFERTEGNPLFVLELARHLEHNGAITRKDELFSFIESDLNMPDNIEELVSNRLNMLSVDALRLAEIASCIGREFDINILTSVSGVEFNESGFKDLTSSGIATSSTVTGSFSHNLFREIMYNSITPRWKSTYHKQLGERYELEYEKRGDEVIFELARHFSMTNEHQKSIRYGMRAGERAESTFAPEQAIQFYESALASLNKFGEMRQATVTKVDMLVKIAQNYEMAGMFDKGLEALNSAMNLSDEKDTMAQLGWRKASIMGKKGMFMEALSEIESASSLVDETTHQFMQLNNERAWILNRLGKYDESIELMQWAVPRLQGADGMTGLLALAYNTLGANRFSKGEFDLALENYRKSLEIRLEASNLSGIIACHINIGAVYFEKGSPNEALGYYQKALEIARKSNDIWHMGAIFNNIGNIYGTMGNLNAAIEYQNNNLRIKEKMGDLRGKAIAHLNLGFALFFQGRFEEAMEHHRAAMVDGERTRSKYLVSAALIQIGNVNIETEQLREATEYFERGLEISREIQSKDLILSALAGLVENNLLIGHVDEAMKHASEMEIISEETGMKARQGVSKHLLGKVHLAMGDPEKAEILFSESVRILEKAESEPDLAKVLFDWGSMNNREPGGISRLERAIAIFEKGGMMAWAEKCRKALQELDQ